MTDSRELALAAAEACAEKKGRQIVLLHLEGISLLADWFVLASGGTPLQVRALADSVEERLRLRQRHPLRREGYHEGLWVLLDYGDVVVHIFREEERRYYDLERLWGDAPREAWPENAAGMQEG